MRVLLVGHEGGVGQAIQKVAMFKQNFVLYNGDIRQGVTKSTLSGEQYNGIIYCAGVNLISKFEDVTKQQFIESMLVNCYGFAEVLQELLKADMLEEFSRACIVTSNAANIPMTHSLSYNCSKAAANMMVRQLAREIPANKVCIFGVAPNKLHNTPMSREIDEKVCKLRGWTQREARQYQRNALPARQETDVHDLAEFICDLQFDPKFRPWVHGTILPFGGPQ